MRHKPVDVFVSSRGNAFMTDIARWVVEAARQAGRTATLVCDRLPSASDAINLVVAPHELFLLDDASDSAVGRAAAASVPICTEQPGTPWFNLTAGLIRDAPVVIDINPRGVDAIRARGHQAMHLQLGGVPSMKAPEVDRDVDVLFLGGSTPRRAAALAPLAPLLWNRESQLRLFRFSAPVDGAAPGTVFGDDKYGLLARSQILVNVHRDDALPGYFEWARMVEAMANGCAVLTEPSTGYEPLIEAKHFVVADHLAVPLAELLDDPDRCRAIGEAARSAVLDEHPLVESLAPVLDRLDEVAPGRPRRHRKPVPRAHRAPLFGELRPAAALRRRVYVASMDEQRLQRHIDRTRCTVLHGTDDFVERFETPAYATAEPTVSVIVTLYNYADLVTDTLASLVASHGVRLEIVVVDDHSRDGGRAIVRRFMADHADVPMLLLASDANRGLPASRNLAVAAARAERIMVMDADNTVYPTCLRRLSDALDDDPTAAFAYATLEAFGVHPGLRSELGWSPRWLCESNYIDAQAMVRRDTYERHGGYREDDDFAYGWEDWELWLRLAGAGEHGVHVPQMLGRYRTQASSMITITNLVADEMRAHIRSLHPMLPWPEDDRA
ncbi:MAG TPA: glycosyltransferase [Ilumatobacter sp.]|nr:glycosyltransferase [Ilumatobacter sp.]